MNIKRERVEVLLLLPTTITWDQWAAGAQEGPDVDLEHAEAARILRHAMGKLSRRAVYVLQMRFGFGDCEPSTLAALGAELGVGRERIRRIQNDALDRLRREIIHSVTTIDRTMAEGRPV